MVAENGKLERAQYELIDGLTDNPEFMQAVARCLGKNGRRGNPFTAKWYRDGTITHLDRTDKFNPTPETKKEIYAVVAIRPTPYISPFDEQLFLSEEYKGSVIIFAPYGNNAVTITSICARVPNSELTTEVQVAHTQGNFADQLAMLRMGGLEFVQRVGVLLPKVKNAKPGTITSIPS